MKRTPLKRKATPARRTELRPNVEKVREFLTRGRASSGRSLRESARAGIAARSGRAAKEGPLDGRSWRRAAFTASAGMCRISQTRARDADDPRFHAHHLLPKQALRRHGLHAYVWDPRNALWLRTDVHMNHEHGTRRIGRELLPAAVWEFAQELDALEGTSWATELVARLYPATGSSGNSGRGG